MKKTQKKTHKITSCITHPKEAHMSEQIDVPSPSTDVSKIGTHLVVTQMKTGAKVARWGQSTPWIGRPPLPQLPIQVHFGGKPDLILPRLVASVSMWGDGKN